MRRRSSGSRWPAPIVALGDGVTAWRIGDHVCALTPGGGYAEYCTTPAGFCLPIPDGLDAAGGGEPAGELLHRLEQRVRPRPPRARRNGADPRRLERHRAHRDPARASVRRDGDHDGRAATTRPRSAATIGADHAINYRTQDFVAEVARITGKRGVDVVLDMVGGDYIEKNLKCLALEGRLVIIAFLQGGRAEIDWRHIMMRRLTVTGSTLRASPLARKVGDRAGAARERLAAARARRSCAGRSTGCFRSPKRPRRTR